MAYIKISKKKYLANLAKIISLTKGSKNLILVLKDNAYGHGLFIISSLALSQGITRVALKSLQDSLTLASGFKEILLLSEHPKATFLPSFSKNHAFGINSLEQIPLISSGTKVHLKIDSSMHRNGICKDELKAALALIKAHKLCLKGIFTHFASSLQRPLQMSIFAEIKSEFNSIYAKDFKDVCFHSFNSDALFCEPLPKDELARIGLGAFGYYPGMQNVLSLHAQLLSKRLVKKGEHIGYEGRFKADKDIQVGCYDLGYADGLFRFSGQKDLFLPKGQKMLGIMSMDSFSSNCVSPTLCVMEDATYFAKYYNTIVYEILVKLNANIKRILDEN